MALPRDIANSGDRPKTIADQQEIGWLQMARGHAMGRNSHVAKVFCYLSVMRAADLIAAHSKVLISPSDVAVPQDFRASGGNQAAHYLPGFVAIKLPQAKAKGLWEFVPYAEARQDLESLFRATQDLEAGYNRADSAAEARRSSGAPGLKQLFGECCQAVIDQPPMRSRNTAEILIAVDRPLLIRVYRRWCEGSLEAYRFAATGKSASIDRKKPADVRSTPRTDLAAGALNEWTIEDLAARTRDQQRLVSGRTSTVEEFSDQQSFLRAYANATGEDFPVGEPEIHKIEMPFSAHKRPAWLVSHGG